MTRLVVDGYNIIHAWPDLAQSLHRESLEEARRRLIARLGEYRASTGSEVLVVFDAGKRRRGTSDREVVDGVEVRYGSVQESADHVIERLMYEASRKGAVLDTVLATDDHLQRDMVSAMGVPTMSAQALRAEVERAEDDRSVEMRRRDGGPAAGGRTENRVENRIENRVENRIENRIDPDVRRRLEEMRRGGDTGR